LVERERILILGATALGECIVRDIDARGGVRTVIGVLDDVRPPGEHPAADRYLGPVARLRAVLTELQPTHIVVALAERRGNTPLRVLLESYVSRHIIVEDALDFSERLTGKIPLESLTPMGVIASGRFRAAALHQVVARTTSLAAALAALVVLSPFLAIIALAIKIDSPGRCCSRSRASERTESRSRS
jgi:hypothetical protein